MKKKSHKKICYSICLNTIWARVQTADWNSKDLTTQKSHTAVQNPNE